MEKITSKKITTFRNAILQWAANIHRPMPWKGEKDPYKIWLSEIILQQTRVEQGSPYFLRFVEHFPSIHHLASAPEDEVMRLWKGLGYYSRAKNLHATAKYITDNYNGSFPSSFKQILSLKGIGPYTAAAIASFAFNLPHAVVDGNVYRVLSRFFNLETPIDSSEGKKKFSLLAHQLLDPQKPGKYNQAIMDFGAIQCLPKQPQCPSCPLNMHCQAYQLNTTSTLPVKKKKIQKTNRFFHYLVIKKEHALLFKKRTQKDIWRSLYDFPLLEKNTTVLPPDEIKQSPLLISLTGTNPSVLIKPSKPYFQTLTHQKITAVFWEIEHHDPIQTLPPNFIFLPQKKLHNFAFPKTIDLYLQDKMLYL